MHQLKTLTKRELFSYFYSPVAYIFLVIFLISLVGFTFVLGNFYESNHASLEIFFNFHPWLYLFLVPAIGMRLWAEEKSQGTDEILFTLPIPMSHLIAAKFLASWIFIAVALALTFPIVFTTFYLGSPDFGPILTGYFGSWLMAGAFLAITCFTSAMTKNQVISFVIAVILCLFFTLLGFGIFQGYMDFLPVGLREFLANLGFIAHFRRTIQGVIEFRDLVYFISMIVFFLMLNAQVLRKERLR
jgi:ABC-2 type transport system permease protein